MAITFGFQCRVCKVRKPWDMYGPLLDACYSCCVTMINDLDAVIENKNKPMNHLKPVYLSHGAADYPKLATLAACPEIQDIVTVALPPLVSPSGRKQSRKPIAFFNEQTELLAYASTAPAMFQPILATSPLSDYGLMSGVLLQSWEEELSFYQELTLQLIIDGSLQPEAVESKFNRIIKLASLGSQHKNYLATREVRNEAQLAAQRAITAAINLCKLSIPQETTTHVNR